MAEQSKPVGRTPSAEPPTVLMPWCPVCPFEQYQKDDIARGRKFPATPPPDTSR